MTSKIKPVALLSENKDKNEKKLSKIKTFLDKCDESTIL